MKSIEVGSYNCAKHPRLLNVRITHADTLFISSNDPNTKVAAILAVAKACESLRSVCENINEVDQGNLGCPEGCAVAKLHQASLDLREKVAQHNANVASWKQT